MADLLRDALRVLVLALAAANIGCIVAVWLTAWRRQPRRRRYVTFMAVWGMSLLLVSVDLVVTRLGHNHLTWHSPVLGTVYLFGVLGFGNLLHRMRTEAPPRR